jgi:RING finger/CHY zinc finger protein 1
MTESGDNFNDRLDSKGGGMGEMGDMREAGEYEKLEEINNIYETCGHYVSSCKIISKCCNKEFGCRFCHDKAVTDHEINRYDIEEVICNICKMRQPVSNSCVNQECSNKIFASYYCGVCHLYSHNPFSEIYHCEECKICRICSFGSTRDDYFHCDKCGGCINKRIKETHKCVEDSLKNDCCICLENIFLSRETVSILPCGHAIHSSCYVSSLEQDKLTCPLCRKTMISDDQHKMVNSYYDKLIELHPVTEVMSIIIKCNDCEFNGEVNFHPIGLKCTGCGGYNTRKN